MTLRRWIYRLWLTVVRWDRGPLVVVPYILALGFAALLIEAEPPLPDPQWKSGPVEIGGAEANEWRPVALPFRQTMDMAIPGSYQLSPDGLTWTSRYRVIFIMPQPEPAHDRAQEAAGSDTAEPWGVMIPSYSTHVVLRVNGHLINDSQWQLSSISYSQNAPMHAIIPAPLLQPGANRLDVELEASARIASYISDIYIGPNRALLPNFHIRSFIFNTLPRLTFAWIIGFALSLFFIWTARSKEWRVLLFSAVLFINGINQLPMVLPPSLEIPTNILRLTNFSFVFQMPLLLVLVLQYCEKPVPRWLFYAFAGFVPCFVILYFIAPPAVMRGFALVVLGPGAVGVTGYCVWLMIQGAWHRSDAGFHMLAAGMLTLQVLAVHDIAHMYFLWQGEQIYLSRFAVPVFLLSIALVWMRRFAMALNAVDRFNSQLRREIMAAEAALRASFAREQAREQAAVVEAERSRLTRDLHDGLAGQLMSIVAMSQKNDRPAEAIGTAARHALADLRLVIASMADVGEDLAMMLATFRDQIAPQLRAMGVQLDWRMSVIPDLPGLNSSTALEIFRILQEATTNAARHSGSAVVTIETTLTPDGKGVRVVVSDRGQGGAVPRNGGHGLGTMHRRAQAIGATLTVVSGTPDSGAADPGMTNTSSPGTRVILDLPINRMGGQ